ncbi:hypothetical protein BDA96_02G214900 [Sorghum bicolor]|uniref:Uncharacterized protein n=2 Tax=Sorghum bicolor TaxID=4558 RepID=A0A921RQ29_SORBI|nr:hypothetical protein BDA96_02G214900 [Sorghum bicolor]OQU89507.1 hypothetical protein SORBI_3002G204050 [Sorghum bicolor]
MDLWPKVLTTTKKLQQRKTMTIQVTRQKRHSNKIILRHLYCIQLHSAQEGLRSSQQ